MFSVIKVLTIPDVATFLRIPKSSVYKLVHEGRLPTFKVGKHFRFVEGEVQDWMDKVRGIGHRKNKRPFWPNNQNSTDGAARCQSRQSGTAYRSSQVSR